MPVLEWTIAFLFSRFRPGIKMDFQSPSNRKNLNTLLAGLIVLAGMAVYLNALGNGFVFDDHPMIEGRAFIRHPTFESGIEAVLGDYRPVREAALMVLSALGGPYPITFHLANVLFHLINAVLVYAIARELSGSVRIGALSSLLFSVHPVQTDAVAYVSGIRDTLSSGFVLAGLYFFMAYRRRHGPVRLAAALAMLVLGIATKEMAVGLIPLVFLYDLQAEATLRTNRPTKNGFGLVGTVVKRHGLFYLALMLLAALAMGFYLYWHHSSARIQNAGINWWGGSFLLNSLTVPILWVTYLKKLIWPLPLMADYMGYPLVANSPADIRSWASLLVLTAVVLTAFRWIRVRPLAGFALGWTLVTLVPVVQILPHHELFAEHHLYLPSVGFCLLAAVAIDRMMRTDRNGLKWAAGVTAVVLVAAYSLQTIKRNGEWRNDLTLFRANLRAFPKAPRSYMQLGNYFQSHNLFASARRSYDQSLALKPDFGMAHNNLGVLFYQSGHAEESIPEFKKALHGELGAYLPAYGNLARAYLRLGRHDDAVAALNEGLERRPDDPKLVAALYYANHESGNEDRADAFLRRWIQRRPVDPAAVRELAERDSRRLNFDGAIAAYDHLLALVPSDKKIKGKRAELLEARAVLREGLHRINGGGGGPRDFLNVAETYGTLGAGQQAEDTLAMGIGRFPDDPDLAKSYLGRLIKDGKTGPGDLKRLEGTLDGFRGGPEVDLLLAVFPAVSGRLEEAFQGVRDSISSLPPDHRARRVSVPEAQNPSPCDQSIYLSGILDSMGFPKAALGLLQASRCGKDGLGTVHTRRAGIYLELGRSDAAVREYEEILRSDPEFAPAHLALGQLLAERVGDYESARDHFSEAVRLAPGIEGSNQIKALVALLDRYVNAVEEGAAQENLSRLSGQIGQQAAGYRISTYKPRSADAP
jgi:tetratricopeptide (TPR) repeat protein